MNLTRTLLTLFVWLMTQTAVQAQDTPILEYQIKASYLYNFLQFVEWEGFGEADSEYLVIGVLGKDRFGVALDSLQGKSVAGKRIDVRRYLDIEEIDTCHVLFVSNSEKKQIKYIFQYLGDKSVLTVGEIKDFAAKGGIINFVIDEDRISFEINQLNADSSGLKISSQLLNLAVKVYR